MKLGVMTMNEFSSFPKDPGLELHHQMISYLIQEGLAPLCSRPIRHPQPTWLYECINLQLDEHIQTTSHI